MINGKQNFENEIAAANLFILDHKVEAKLSNFIKDMQDMPWLPHSDRWSRVYDFINENYPEYTHLVTGFTYWLE